MCGIVGYTESQPDKEGREKFLTAFKRTSVRGRDSWGLRGWETPSRVPLNWLFWPNNGEGVVVVTQEPSLLSKTLPMALVGNRRGEPTTEWVQAKSAEDVQPFWSPSGEWVFTHNGTIANDAEIYEKLRSELGPLPLDYKPPTRIDSYAIGVALDHYGFEETVRSQLTGSFALIAIHRDMPGWLHYATNYKPLYGWSNGTAAVLSSLYDDLAQTERLSTIAKPRPVRIEPYTWGHIGTTGLLVPQGSLYPERTSPRKTLVVCSGGLDSGTLAWRHHHLGDQVTLLHLTYGAKAEEPEIQAVKDLGLLMDAPVVMLNTDFFTNHAMSVLTDPNGVITRTRDGVAGAEFAHEWVPARNTVMLSLALAFAEANDYDVIALGSNMEEGGAYPDNEMEFINRFRDLAPYALKPYKQVTFSDRYGGFVKHEIVRDGAAIGMPFELTWSCYEGVREGNTLVHCGTCGPCSMRRSAFKMAHVYDPTRYVKESK